MHRRVLSLERYKASLVPAPAPLIGCSEQKACAKNQYCGTESIF